MVVFCVEYREFYDKILIFTDFLIQSITHNPIFVLLKIQFQDELKFSYEKSIYLPTNAVLLPLQFHTNKESI